MTTEEFLKLLSNLEPSIETLESIYDRLRRQTTFLVRSGASRIRVIDFKYMMIAIASWVSYKCIPSKHEAEKFQQRLGVLIDMCEGAQNQWERLSDKELTDYLDGKFVLFVH